jgi:hypothetical protein
MATLQSEYDLIAAAIREHVPAEKKDQIFTVVNTSFINLAGVEDKATLGTVVTVMTGGKRRRRTNKRKGRKAKKSRKY